MPWKESSVMEERLRFVAQLLEGEAMTDVCRDFLRLLDNKAGFERLRPKPQRDFHHDTERNFPGFSIAYLVLDSPALDG